MLMPQAKGRDFGFIFFPSLGLFRWLRSGRLVYLRIHGYDPGRCHLDKERGISNWPHTRELGSMLWKPWLNINWEDDAACRPMICLITWFPKGRMHKYKVWSYYPQDAKPHNWCALPHRKGVVLHFLTPLQCCWSLAHRFSGLYYTMYTPDFQICTVGFYKLYGVYHSLIILQCLDGIRSLGMYKWA